MLKINNLYMMEHGSCYGGIVQLKKLYGNGQALVEYVGTRSAWGQVVISVKWLGVVK